MVSDERRPTLPCLVVCPPGLEDVVHTLGLGRMEMPTATLAHVRIDIEDWMMLGGRGQATLERFWLARALEE